MRRERSPRESAEAKARAAVALGHDLVVASEGSPTPEDPSHSCCFLWQQSGAYLMPMRFLPRPGVGVQDVIPMVESALPGTSQPTRLVDLAGMAVPIRPMHLDLA